MTIPRALDVSPVYASFKKAKDAAAVGDETSAERYCDEAWQQIPEPKYGWDSSYVCTLHMSTLLRGLRLYDKAIDVVNGYLQSGFHLEYQDGPYFWLGAIYFEKGELSEAYSYLSCADKMSRGRCFREEDPKYKSFLKTFKAEGRNN
jgi:TolA-binding protein